MGNTSSYHEAIERKRRVRCFMDGIDWQHHLDADRKGTKLFASVEALKEGGGHSLDQCGIVEVEVRLIEWVEPQNLHPERDDEKNL